MGERWLEPRRTWYDIRTPRAIIPVREPSLRVYIEFMPPLGDLVTQLPVLHALHDRVPGLDTEVCVSRGVHGLLEDYDWIGRIHVREKDWRSRLGPYASSWRRPFDLLLYLRSNPTIKLPRILMRARRKVGTEAYDPAASERVIPHRYSVLRHVFADELPEIRTSIFLRPERTREALAAAGAKEGARILCVAPGASQPARRWPIERWGELLQAVGSDFDARVVLGSPAETEMCATAAEAGNAVSLAGAPLTRIAALLGTSAAFVGNDSGLGHLAAAQGCATLTLGLAHPYYHPCRGHAIHGAATDITVPAAVDAMVEAKLVR